MLLQEDHQPANIIPTGKLYPPALSPATATASHAHGIHHAAALTGSHVLPGTAGCSTQVSVPGDADLVEAVRSALMQYSLRELGLLEDMMGGGQLGHAEAAVVQQVGACMCVCVHAL